MNGAFGFAVRIMVSAGLWPEVLMVERLIRNSERLFKFDVVYIVQFNNYI